MIRLFHKHRWYYHLCFPGHEIHYTVREHKYCFECRELQSKQRGKWIRIDPWLCNEVASIPIMAMFHGYDRKEVQHAKNREGIQMK